MMVTNILAIDDDKNILYTISEICKYKGWNVFTANDFETAKKYIDEFNLDVILVDYHMPDINGVDIVKYIRKNNVDTPIIALTVEEKESIIDKFMSAGASDYVLKPIKAHDFSSRINVHLKLSKMESYYTKSDKGISKVTLEKILTYLKSKNEYIDTEEISENTNISVKTVYRYLKYLTDNNIVMVKHEYRDAGRPRNLYMLKK